MLDDKEFLDGVYRKAGNYKAGSEKYKYRRFLIKNMSAAAIVVLILSSIAISAGNNVSKTQLRNDEHNISIQDDDYTVIKINGTVTSVSTSDNVILVQIKTDEGKIMELLWDGSVNDISVGEQISVNAIRQEHALKIKSIEKQEN